MRNTLILLLIITTIYAFKFIVIHTNDLHSQFEGDRFNQRGHYAKIYHQIKQIENNTPHPVLKLDTGDWFSGSLFHLLSIHYVSPFSCELQFFDDLKYDAISLGNHEFDIHDEGLLRLIEKARKLKLKIPILASNMKINDSPKCKRFKEIENSLNSNSVHSEQVNTTDFFPYLVKTLKDKNGNTIKVGLLGLFGPNAALLSTNNRECSHFVGFDDTESEINFKVYTNHVLQLIRKLRGEHFVDIVIAMSHSGKPEDVQLISSLQKHSKYRERLIDIHLSGHSHAVYSEMKSFAKHTKTIIHQNEPYGATIGVLEVELKNDEINVLNVNKSLIPIKGNTPADESVMKKIQHYKTFMNKYLLKDLSWSFDSKIGKSNRTFKNTEEFGNWICECIRSELNFALQYKNFVEYMQSFDPSITNYVTTRNLDTVDLYFTSLDMIRTNSYDFQNQTFTFADAFQILGTGYTSPFWDEKNLPGEFIVLLQINKYDIKKIIYGSNLYYHIFGEDSAKISFSENLVYDLWFGFYPTNIKINGKPLSEYKDRLLIGVPATLANFIVKVPKLTFGLLKLDIFNSKGQIINDMKKEYTYFKEYILFSNHLQRQISMLK